MVYPVLICVVVKWFACVLSLYVVFFPVVMIVCPVHCPDTSTYCHCAASCSMLCVRLMSVCVLLFHNLILCTLLPHHPMLRLLMLSVEFFPVCGVFLVFSVFLLIVVLLVSYFVVLYFDDVVLTLFLLDFFIFVIVIWSFLLCSVLFHIRVALFVFCVGLSPL